MVDASRSKRVYGGLGAEEQVAEFFGLKPGEKHGKDQPDILDIPKGCVGEVKTHHRGDRVCVSVEQFERYKKLAESLQDKPVTTLDGEHYSPSLSYFFTIHNGSQKVEEIYVVNAATLEGFIQKSELRNTRWNLKQYDVEKLRLLGKSEQQLLDNSKKSELSEDVVRGSGRGTWIRMREFDLQNLCPNYRMISGITVHYSDERDFDRLFPVRQSS